MFKVYHRESIFVYRYLLFRAIFKVLSGIKRHFGDDNKFEFDFLYKKVSSNRVFTVFTRNLSYLFVKFIEDRRNTLKMKNKPA